MEIINILVKVKILNLDFNIQFILLKLKINFGRY